MISSSSSDQPSSSSSSALPSSSAFPCCSSSSSDEAETDIRGWPTIISTTAASRWGETTGFGRILRMIRRRLSDRQGPFMSTASGARQTSSSALQLVPLLAPALRTKVLETPDRRRMRKTWRSVAIRVDLNKFSESDPHLLPNIQRPLPAIISRNQYSTFSPNKKCSRLTDSMTHSIHCSPSNNNAASDTQFTSPLMRKLPHSPDLRTPKTYIGSQPRHVHLSVSPMSAFFIRQRVNAEDGSGTDCPTKHASSSSSLFSVLRPFNFQNYIGIRFSGEQSKKSTEPQSNAKKGGDNQAAASFSLPIDENTQTSSCSSTSVSFVTSKGNSSSDDSGFLDCSTLSSSSAVETPNKGLFLPHHPCKEYALPTSSASLFIGFDHLMHSHNAVHSTSFNPTTAAIPEQSYGPLEASVMDGILKDLSHWTSTNAKTTGNWTSPQRCSLLFERKLRDLEVIQIEKTQTRELQGELSDSMRIPSDLVLEMGETAEELTLEELRMLLPDLSECSIQLMFGLSPDQIELTQMAHSFLDCWLTAQQQNK